MIEAHSINSILERIDSSFPRKAEPIKSEPIEHNIGFMTALDMSKPVKSQNFNLGKNQSTKLVGLLLAPSSVEFSKKEVTAHLNRFHYRSGQNVDFFCVGYGTHWSKEKYPDKVLAERVGGVDWYYSDKAFTAVVDDLERVTKWEYSGEVELLLVTAKKDGDQRAFLDYQTAIVCNLERMAKDKAFTSVRSFFEDIFKFTKENTTSSNAFNLSDRKGLDIGASAIRNCILSLLPKNIRDDYKKIEHYAIRNLEQ